MRPLRVHARIPMLFSMTILCISLVTQGLAQVQTVGAATPAGGPTVTTEAEHHDLSAPLRDMKAADVPASATKRALPLRSRPATGKAEANAADGAVQSSTKGPTVVPAAMLNFDGVGVPNYTVTGTPPDTEGAVGSTQYVQWVNTAFSVYRKSDGVKLLGPKNGNDLWAGFGGDCQTTNDGDPIVLYDHLANRWFFTQFAVSHGTSTGFLECIAVSQTSDATGAYYRYSYNYGTNAFIDYPKAGIWPDAYYITYNIFNGAGTAFVSDRVCAFDRARMLSGLSATQQCFDKPYTGVAPSAFGWLPSDLDGATLPPAGEPNFLLEEDADNATSTSLYLFKLHIDWATPTNSALSGPTAIAVASYTNACSTATAFGVCIPQKGTANVVDSLSDRLMYRLAYRNFGDHESLVVNHSVTVGTTPSGVRWYEIRNPNGTPTVYQQSTFSPDANSRWMGSIAMDHKGDMALGYSESSSSMYPSIAYTGRLVTDTLSTMQAESIVLAGLGSELVQSRWGDYSAMTVDPTDDCTFWYTQEYWQSSGDFSWSTRIISFKFPSCSGGGPPPTPTGLHVTGATYNSLTWGWSESDAAAVIIFTTDGVHFYSLAAGTTSYTLTGIAYGFYACLSIAAYDNSLASSYTPYSCKNVVPLAPYNPHQTAGTTSTGTIAWANFDTYSYEQVYDYSGAAWHQVGQNGTSYTLTGIPAGYYHCAAVQAYNVDYASGYSYACPFATPNAPTNIHATSVSSTSVTFAWDAPDPYSWYYVYETAPAAGHVITATSFTTTHLIISGAHAYACIYVAAGGYGGTSSYPYACAWAY